MTSGGMILIPSFMTTGSGIVCTWTISGARVLELLTRRIYEVHQWNNLKWHYIHTKIHDDHLEHSSNISLLCQQFQRLQHWYYWWGVGHWVGMIYIPRSTKIGTGVRKLLHGDTQSHTKKVRWSHKHFIFFFKMWESRLKTESLNIILLICLHDINHRCMESLPLCCEHISFQYFSFQEKKTGINQVIIHQPLRNTIPAMDCVVLYKIFDPATEADLLSVTTGTQYTWPQSKPTKIICDQTNARSSRSKLASTGSKSLHLTDVSVQEITCKSSVKLSQY